MVGEQAWASNFYLKSLILQICTNVPPPPGMVNTNTHCHHHPVGRVGPGSVVGIIIEVSSPVTTIIVHLCLQ